MQEEEARRWLNFFVKNKMPVVLKGGSGGSLFQADLLLNSADGYYREHPEECWLFEIGKGYKTVFSSELVEKFVISSYVLIVLKGG